MRYLNRHRPLLAIATILILVTSCASSEGDEQLDEPMFEEADQEEAAEQIEQLPQEETAPSNVTDALASELDQLADPSANVLEQETMTPPEDMASGDTMMPSEEPLPGAGQQMTEAPQPAAPQPAAPQPLPVIEGDVGEYVVQPGDTLGGISVAIYGTMRHWNQIASDNAISTPNLIRPGDVIRYRINGRAETFKAAYEATEQEVIMVQAGDTLEILSERLFGRKDYWKPMWRLNTIEMPNPHRIFSGQILRYVDPKKMTQAMAEKGIKLAH